MSKPDVLAQRPLRPSEFHFSAPVVGGSGAEQISGYGRLGTGIVPCVDMTIVLPDGLPLSVVSVEVSLPSGDLRRTWLSVSFAPLQPGEAQQAREAMRAAGWTVTGGDVGPAAEEAEPTSDDLDDLEADAQAEGTDDDDDEQPELPSSIPNVFGARRKPARAGARAERKPAAAKAKAKTRR